MMKFCYIDNADPQTVFDCYRDKMLALESVYSDDGGHLNSVGSERVAQAFIVMVGGTGQ